MLGLQKWVEGVILDVYEDFSDVWVQIGNPASESDDGEDSPLFDFRIEGEQVELPFDRKWWESNKGKKVCVDLMVKVGE